MRSLLSLCTLSLATSIACAQPAPDYGFEWRTIGDPGNPDARVEDYFYLQFGPGPVGGVDYTYRLTRTEVTNTQWIEFVDMYSRLNPSVYGDPGFHGRDVFFTSSNPDNFGWTPFGGAENSAAVVAWLYAARFCNWLHNGKVNQLWAFENGAYDMSTYHDTPTGWVGQLTRSPGARFWIPNQDEWTKGLHWDPNKHGVGQGGYWLYPHSSDTPPIGGAPGTPGAQTSAGGWDDDAYQYVPVGSYLHAQSPWGLLDGSGGAAEYMEGGQAPGALHSTWTRFNSIHPYDRLDFSWGTLPNAPVGGLRIASIVPSPASMIALFAIGGVLPMRRRHVRECSR